MRAHVDFNIFLGFLVCNIAELSEPIRCGPKPFLHLLVHLDKFSEMFRKKMNFDIFGKQLRRDIFFIPMECFSKGTLYNIITLRLR